MKGLHRAGLHLSEDVLTKVKALQKEIAKLSLEFSRNITLDKSTINVSQEALQGVSSEFLSGLKKDEAGNYIIPCTMPTRDEILNHCSVSDTRRAFLHAYHNRAYPVNKAILETIFAKRYELARLLGFESYGHYDLDNQMAKTPEVAEQFIIDLANKVAPKAKKEFDRLVSDLPDGVVLVDGKFSPSDLLYANQQYKKKHFSLDDREVAQYFTMEKTIEGIFSIYQKFLGLEFTLLKPEGLWHDDATVIEVKKKGNHSVEGYIFLDLHPRENKYSHACCASLVPPLKVREGMKKRPSVSMVIANFPKSTEQRPSLLKHNDVETFFHEFGHAMHHLLGRTEMNEFAGYETKHEFVEVPSQMFEEWMWDKVMLKNVTAHYKTGESLSEALLDTMLALKRFDKGYFVQRQCSLALIALAYHKAGAHKDLDAVYGDVYDRIIKHVARDPELHMYASFGHLTGYAAKYYGYMWSKVFALDLFNAVRKHGLLDGATGARFIDTILGKGGAVDPSLMLKNFLGREANQDAFLQDIGV